MSDRPLSLSQTTHPNEMENRSRFVSLYLRENKFHLLQTYYLIWYILDFPAASTFINDSDAKVFYSK